MNFSPFLFSLLSFLQFILMNENYTKYISMAQLQSTECPFKNTLIYATLQLTEPFIWKSQILSHKSHLYFTGILIIYIDHLCLFFISKIFQCEFFRWKLFFLFFSFFFLIHFLCYNINAHWQENVDIIILYYLEGKKVARKKQDNK